MGIRPGSQSPDCTVKSYIDSAYDNVKTVSDSIDDVNRIADNIDILKYGTVSFVQEEVPVDEGIYQGVRWYKPSVPAMYIYYINEGETTGSWVEDNSVGDDVSLDTIDVDGGLTLRQYLASLDSINGTLDTRVTALESDVTSLTGRVTTNESKLTSIETGAQVNTVDTVAGKAGTVVLDGSDVNVTGGTLQTKLDSIDSEVDEVKDTLTLKIFQSPTDNLTKVTTYTGSVGTVFEVRKTSDNTLADIYSDKDGLNPIAQNGTGNVSDANAEVVFYIADGDYTVTINSVQSQLKVGDGECTASEIASGLYAVGSRLTVTDRASATFDIVSGGTPNGFEVLDAGGGNTAVLEIDTMNIDPMQLGASGDAVIGEGISNEGTNDDIYLQRAVDLAGTKKSDITNKITQVTGQVVLKRLFAFTQLDIPSGVAVLGNPAFGGLVDIGIATNRAAIEIGDPALATESAFCGLDGALVKGNRTINRILVRYNLCLRKCFHNRTNIYNGWRNLETTTSWALEFKSNYIWGAIESCAVLDNGTANKWSDNRLEIAGEAVLVIDGSGGQEPVNVVLNGGSIQFGDKEGIKGIDIVTLESYGVFYEGNNKLGGYDFISIVKGGLGKSADLVLIKGGFFTQGGGAGGRAIYADAKTIIVETEIRGNGFTHGVVATPSTKYLDVKGIMPSVGNAVSGFNSDTCVVKIGLGDRDSTESGVVQQKERRRNRSVSSSTTSQPLDYNVTCATTSNDIEYTLRDEDFQDGRTIILRKSTTESVNAITVVPPPGKSAVGNSTKSNGMAVIEINILGNNAFCY